LLITMGTPEWYLWLGYRSGWLNVLRRQIVDFVGLKVAHMKTIGPVRDAKPEGIAAFMDVARKLAI
jgi:NAD(P)H dehydrogenase (quinone)